MKVPTVTLPILREEDHGRDQAKRWVKTGDSCEYINAVFN